MVKKCKNNTKNGITWVWNELRPKLQAFNKGHFEKFVLTSAVTTWYLTMSPFVPEKRPNSTKVNFSFYERLKEDRALILTDLVPDGYFWFWPSSGGKSGSKLDQKLKFWVSPVNVKIWALQNTLNGICKAIRTTCGQNFGSIRRYLLELLPRKTQNGSK